MSYVLNTLTNLLDQTAFMNLTVGNYVMIAVACVFLYLAIKHGFEPLLLVPIAFGMLLVNIYPDIMAEPYVDAAGIEHAEPPVARIRAMSLWCIRVLVASMVGMLMQDTRFSLAPASAIA